MSNTFWKFPACAKHDEIDELRHPKLWAGALSSPETGIYSLKKGEYVLYGDQEALLFRPKRRVFKLALELFSALKSLGGEKKSA